VEFEPELDTKLISLVSQTQLLINMVTLFDY
jgi:hypothetical protein